MFDKHDSYLRQTQAYWDNKATTAKSDAERVEWSQRSQRMRFETFLMTHDLQNRSVLDVGCGVADFRTHLQRRNVDCEYVGFDISPEMIRHCKERFPDLRFESGNFLTWEPGRSFDYTVAIGIHNIKVDGAYDVLESTTRKQFELSRIAAHVSLLTDRFHGFAPHIQAWKVEDIMAMALAITPYVVIRHDYLPNDFSITLYRDPLIDRCNDLLLD